MQVVIINGHGEAGKDTFVQYCADYVGINYVLNISTVDFIKSIARQLGWNGQKDNQSRKALSNLKDMATAWGDIPFIDIFRRTWNFYDELTSFGVQGKGFVFIHCREPEEIQKIKDKINLPTVTLLIRRPGNYHYENHADNNVENYQYDYIINNDGTLQDLRMAAKAFIDEIKKQT